MPYYIAGVAVAIGFKMRLFNIGVDGQYLLGAFWGRSSASIGGANLPTPIYVTLIALVAVVTGMIWAAIPALLKIGRNVNEVISTIMLNYVAGQIIFYFLRNHFRRGDGMVAQTGQLPNSARVEPQPSARDRQDRATPQRRAAGLLAGGDRRRRRIPRTAQPQSFRLKLRVGRNSVGSEPPASTRNGWCSTRSCCRAVSPG